MKLNSLYYNYLKKNEKKMVYLTLMLHLKSFFLKNTINLNHKNIKIHQIEPTIIIFMYAYLSNSKPNLIF